MGTKVFCAHCNQEFTLDEVEDKPRCPKCMRRGGIQAVNEASPAGRSGRRWAAAALVALLLLGGGYAIYRSQTVSLEETPPVRPLGVRELAAYLERDQVEAGAYATMMAVAGNVEGWPETPAEVVEQTRARTSPWSLEHALSREVWTAERTLAAIGREGAREKLYPIEAAAAATVVLRQGGAKAMVAECWEVEGEQAPTDPSGMLGYYLVAIYDEGADQPSRYLDPWGGRDEVRTTSVRVLRDTEVIGAALAVEGARQFVSSGDAGASLSRIETALELDPLSPIARVAHAVVLVEAGGLPQALQELDAAVQLRPDGPRKLNMVQLILAQAGMFEASGEPEAASAQIAEATAMITDVIERWPRYGRAHLTLATVYLGLGDPERARVELEVADSLSPESPMLWAIWAQYHLATRDPTAAAAKMRRAAALDPDSWQMHVEAATVFMAAGDEDAARRHAAEALRLVAPTRRQQLTRYLAQAVGSGALIDPAATASDATGLDLPEPDVGGAPPHPAPSGKPGDPALMLGDPSNLRLRDPDQTLKLELDE